MFLSTHYAGKEAEMKFEDGEAWKKVFGPVFVYLNSVDNGENPLDLWANAKEQVLKFSNYSFILFQLNFPDRSIILISHRFVLFSLDVG